MSHEWNDDKSQDYLESLRSQGASLDAVSKALAKDAIGWQHEFLLRQPLIPFDYDINEDGRWVDEGGKTVEQLNDPNDVGGDRIGRILHAESAMMKDPNVKMAATISPDLGYDRSFVYLFSRGENNTIQALAVEFKGTDAQLQRFFVGLGLQGGADISNSADQNQALLFPREITATQIFEEAKNSLSGDSTQSDYLDRLSQSTSSYPLLLEERKRQIEQYANKAMEAMLSDENVSQGMAMAVFGVMELARQTSDTTVRHVFTESVETISGLIDYIGRKNSSDEQIYMPVAHVESDLAMPQSVQELLKDEHSQAFTSLSILPENISVETTTAISMWKETAQDVLHISKERADALYTEVKQAFEVAQTARDIIHISLDHDGVGIAGALFALHVLSCASDTVVMDNERNSSHDEPRIHMPDHIDQDLVSDEHSDETIIKLLENDLHDKSIGNIQKIIEQNDSVSGVTSKPESIDYETVIKVVDIIQKLNAMPESWQSEFVDLEKNNTQEKIMFLHEIFKLLLKYPQMDTDRRNDLETKHTEQHVQEFSLAVTLLFLFKYMNYFSSLEKIQSAVLANIRENCSHDESPLSLIQYIQKTKPEGIIQKEPTTWLLFAIIWHLAMVREQGAYTAPPAKVQKKKKKHASIPSPVYPLDPVGVIYLAHMI